MVFGLENLKRVIQVHDAGDTRHEALLQRIGGLPVREILLPLRRSGRQVRNLVSLDDALSRR